MDNRVVVVSPPTREDVDNIQTLIQQALSSAGFTVKFTGSIETSNDKKEIVTITTTSTSLLHKQLLGEKGVLPTSTPTASTTPTPTPATTISSAAIDPKYVAALERQLQEKESELDDLENHLTTALTSIQTFHVQQKELFEEFVALRDKYDVQKERLNTAIWEYIPTAEGPLNSIPAIQPAGQVDSLQEDQDSVGDYIFGASLGEGQFAKVRACTKSNAGHMSRLNVRGDYKQSERSSMTDLSSSMNNTQFTSSASNNNNNNNKE